MRMKQPKTIELSETRPSDLALELQGSLKTITNAFAGQLGELTQTMTNAIQKQSFGISLLNQKADRTDHLLQQTLDRVTALEEGRVLERETVRPAESMGQTVSKTLEFEREREMGEERAAPHVSCIPPQPCVTSPIYASPLKQPSLPGLGASTPDERQRKKASEKSRKGGESVSGRAREGGEKVSGKGRAVKRPAEKGRR